MDFAMLNHEAAIKVGIDEVTYDLLVSKISQTAKSQMEEENAKTRNRLAVFITAGLTLFVAAITGVATFGFKSLERSLEDQTAAIVAISVPTAVRDAIDRQIPVIQRDISAHAEFIVQQSVNEKVNDAVNAWDQLNNRVYLRESLLEMLGKGGFSDNEMKGAISNLRGLGQDEKIRNSLEFAELLEKVIDRQTAAGRLDYVDELEEDFKDKMLETSGITWTMSMTLGRRIASFPVDPRHLPAGTFSDDWARLVDDFKDYASASRNNHYPEIPLFFEVVLACMNDRPEPVKIALLSRVDDLNDFEHDQVIDIVSELVEESWRGTPDSDTRRAKNRVLECAQSIDTTGLSDRAVQIMDLAKVGDPL